MRKDTDWRSIVYKEKQVDYKLRVLPRSKVLKRDSYTCQSCRKRLEANRLSIHHIIPRSEGGRNLMTNLITLCHECHDLIELAEPKIRTKQEILYHVKALEELQKQKDEYGDTVPDNWQAWVYGGARRPEQGEIVDI